MTADTVEASPAVRSGYVVVGAVAVLAAVGVGLLVNENGAALVDLGAGSVWIAALWLVYGAVVVWLIVRAQRYGRRPRLYALVALGWGGLAATGVAQQANIALAVIVGESDSGLDTSWSTAPLVEETLKALVVVALATVPRAALRGTLDGLFYGALAGAGFLVVENVAYTVGAVEPETSLVFTTFGMLVVRGVIGGVLGHVVYTALIGAGIGYVVAHRREHPGRATAVLVGFVAIALGAHMIHNTHDGLTLFTFAVSLLPVAILLATLRTARRQERRRLVGLVRAGAGAPVVSADDVDDAHTDPDHVDAALAFVRACEIAGPAGRDARRAAGRLTDS